MAKRQKQKRGVDAKASVKVEAIAKATYQRKRTITEVIPSDVSRAKAGAWLDLISPLTEWAGLRGDELRFKREQLRLQREDVLAEIVSKARERIGSESDRAAIPNKFLVPFLEQASLEGPESKLIELWANLLASAAVSYSSHYVHFVSIISQLSSKQGEVLRSLIGTKDAKALEVSMDNVRMYYQAHSIRELLRGVADEAGDDDALAEGVYKHMGIVGIEMVHCSAENLKTKEYFDITFDYSAYQDDSEVDYSILEAVGLIRRVDTGFFDVGSWAVNAIYFHLTDLGFYFSKACKMVEESEVTSP